jgi:hypothetical protein
MVTTARLQEELDPEIVKSRFAAARSEYNPNAIDCSACGRTVYADTSFYDSYVRSLQYDPSNQFICDECEAAAIDERA